MGTESDRFLEFYRDCYQEEIEQLARNYPDEQRALYIDYEDVVKYDWALAEDFLELYNWMRDSAEDALLAVEHSEDIDLQQVRVRLCNVPTVTVEPGNIPARDEIFGNWVAVQGYVKEASDVTLTLTKAAFICKRCDKVTNVPQSSNELQEPDKCKDCGQQGPFRIEYSDSEFEDRQTVTLVPLPEVDPTADGELEIVLEDDLAGEVAQGERVEVVGLMDADQENSKTAVTVSLTGEAVSRVSPQETGLYSGSYLAVSEGGINEGGLETFVRRSTAVLRTQTLGEFETQSKIITPFLHLLGWNIAHPEVRFEYSDREIGDDLRADYALLDEDESPVFIVEAKQEGKDLDLHIGQLKTYLRVFQARYGLLTNGERYLFFCTNPADDGPSELVVLDCRLSDLEEHQDILAAYSRESIVDDCTSLDVLAEAAQEAEDESETRNLTAREQRERIKRIKGVISDLEEEVEQGAPIDEVYRRIESEFGIPEEEVESELAKLRQKGEVYEDTLNHLRLL